MADIVIVQPEEVLQKTKSGILMADSVEKEAQSQGTVVAIGGGRTTESGGFIPTKLKVGEKVLFPKYGPDQIKIEGILYYVLRESAVLAVIK